MSHFPGSKCDGADHVRSFPPYSERYRSRTPGTDHPSAEKDVMLGDITVADEIYIVCGYTDYPRSIIIQDNTDTSSIIKCF
jgi:hypothetical protein